MSEPPDGPFAPVPVLLLVDAANVVGSVPDGWWRDRAAATQRLCDRLAADPSFLHSGPIGILGQAEVVVVVEGAARGVHGGAAVRVVAADGSADDTIVALVEAESRGFPGAAAGRSCVVVTADAGLRARLAPLGARLVGPAALRSYRR